MKNTQYTILISICLLFVAGISQLQAADDSVSAKKRQAYALLEKGDCSQAKQLFIDVIQRRGGDEEALEGLATCLYIDGDYTRAQRTLNILLQRDSKNAYIHALMGNIYYQENKLKDARESFEKAIKLDNDRASYHNNLGAVLRDLGRESAAEQAFRDALRANRRYAVANYNLAVTLASGSNKNRREARKYYDRALRYGYPPDAELEKVLD